MNNKILGILLTKSLNSLGFKNYGQRLFYIEYNECIVILEQLTYNMAAELYLKVIIKQCHPEITKITKAVIIDKMIIDTFSYNRLMYKTSNGLEYDLYNIPLDIFDEKIKEIYDSCIYPFNYGVIEGITKYNEYIKADKYGFAMDLFIDAAEKIGKPEFAGKKGHEWFLSNEYILLYEYNVDNRFVNANTERYIMENVIKNIPKDLKGKQISKWCNQQCKEIFLMKGKKFFLGWGILFPFVNGKPLKYCGCNVMPPNNYQIYYNEDTKETFHYKRVKDKNAPEGYTFEIVKVD